MVVSPVVSVIMLTYNHEKFIGKAIDSVLLQKTCFPFEVLIGEDKSSDGTRQIVRDYQRRYPDRIRLCLFKTNFFTLRPKPESPMRIASRGKYLAYLEGDDYWTDPQKLQTQVDVLESDTTVAMVHHNVMVVGDEGETIKPRYFPCTYADGTVFDPPARAGVSDLVTHCFPRMCSTIFRKECFDHLTDELRAAPSLDWLFFVRAATVGAVAYVDRVMAAYRVHGAGMWSGASDVSRLEREGRQLALYKKLFGDEHRDQIGAAMELIASKISSAIVQREAGRRLGEPDPKWGFTGIPDWFRAEQRRQIDFMSHSEAVMKACAAANWSAAWQVLRACAIRYPLETAKSKDLRFAGGQLLRALFR